MSIKSSISYYNEKAFNNQIYLAMIHLKSLQSFHYHTQNDSVMIVDFLSESLLNKFD